MNYNSDMPISTKEDDLIGRRLFSEQLGEAIC